MSNNFFIPQTEPSKNIIHSIWQTYGSTPAQREFILPKGVIEIIFNFTKYSKIEAQINNRQYLLGDCFINGFNTFPIQLKHLENQFFFFVCLQLVVVKNFFFFFPFIFAYFSCLLKFGDIFILSLFR
jgi:hypothetical protein